MTLKRTGTNPLITEGVATAKVGAGTGVELALLVPPLEQPKTLLGGGGEAGPELELLAPPPQPASPNADASARALVARYNSLTRLSRRVIGAPCLRPAASTCSSGSPDRGILRAEVRSPRFDKPRTP